MRETSGLVIVQRDEGVLLGANVAYHLSAGFSRIAIVDNCSEDLVTLGVLRSLEGDARVKVLYDRSEICDQARLANWGLEALLADDDIQWVFPCDADEFIWCADGLEAFLSSCRVNGTLYGTLPWLNHISESPSIHADPLGYLQGTLFYVPFPERNWQDPSHFRKAFCLSHPNMEIVVGGHFFRREANQDFFAKVKSCPASLPESYGVIFHFEMRDYASKLLQKWRNLSERHFVSGVRNDGEWREKEQWMRRLWIKYEGCPESLFVDFAGTRCTLWGTKIPADRLRRREDLYRALSSAGVF
jgi:hypothetical protein